MNIHAAINVKIWVQHVLASLGLLLLIFEFRVVWVLHGRFEVKVHRVLHVAYERLEERHVNCSVSKSMVSSSHACQLILCHDLSILVDYCSLLNRSQADVGECVHGWAQWSKACLVTHVTNVSYDAMANLFITYKRRNVHAHTCSDVSHHKAKRLKDVCWDKVCYFSGLLVDLILALLSSLDLLRACLGKIFEGHFMDIPNCERNQVFSAFYIAEHGCTNVL